MSGRVDRTAQARRHPHELLTQNSETLHAGFPRVWESDSRRVCVRRYGLEQWKALWLAARTYEMESKCSTARSRMRNLLRQCAKSIRLYILEATVLVQTFQLDNVIARLNSVSRNSPGNQHFAFSILTSKSV